MIQKPNPMQLMKQSLLAFFLLAASVLPGTAETLAQWNFNSTPPDGTNSTGSLTPSTGAGTASLAGGANATFAAGATQDSGADNTGWNTSSYPTQGASNKTDGVQFRVSTLGFETIVISWEQRDSATASRYTRLQYSADGTHFLDGPVVTHTAGANAFGSQSVSLNSFTSVNNNSNFAFRLVTEFELSATGSGANAYVAAGAGSSYSAAGAIRYDLMTVSGVPATGNNFPTISTLTNQVIRENHNLENVPFTVGDVETPAGDLLVTGASSNQALVPDAGVLIDGTGANRTLSIFPSFFQSGLVTITLTVTDSGGKTSTASFLLTVLPENTPPTLSSFTNYHTLINVALPAIPFTIGDRESPPNDLDVTVSSSNPAVIPAANVVLGGAESNRTVTITPAPGQIGSSVITITVGDTVLATNRSFNVLVLPSADVVLYEPFDYPNGSLITTSGSLWGNHSGTLGQAQVSGGALQLLSSRTEDVSARLVGSPYATNSGKVLYASMTVNFATVPNNTAEYFAHFREVGGGQQARVFVSTTNSPAGTFRLGIANNNASITNAVTLEGDLVTGTDYHVVLRYNVGTGVSTLWVNPSSENSPGATATDTPSPGAIGSFAFRQNSGIGSLRVDDLRIGFAFSDVAEVAPEIRLTILRTAGGVAVSWPAADTDAGYSLQRSATLGATADWQPAAPAPVRNGSRDAVTITSPGGNAFFRLRK